MLLYFIHVIEFRLRPIRFVHVFLAFQPLSNYNYSTHHEISVNEFNPQSSPVLKNHTLPSGKLIIFHLIALRFGRMSNK